MTRACRISSIRVTAQKRTTAKVILEAFLACIEKHELEWVDNEPYTIVDTNLSPAFSENRGLVTVCLSKSVDQAETALLVSHLLKDVQKKLVMSIRIEVIKALVNIHK